MKKSLFCAIFFIALLASCSKNTDNSVDNTPPGPGVNPDQNLYVAKRISSNTDLTLRKVDFIDDKTGFIGGGRASNETKTVILKTQDGGTIWTKVFEEDGSYITGITALSDTRIIAINNKGIILKTEDGGSNWIKDKAFEDAFYMSDIDFLNDKFGVIAGSKGNTGILAITTDGGTTWQKKDNRDIAFLNDKILKSVNFSDNTIWISGGTWNNGILLKSSDLGATWTNTFISSNVMTTDIEMKNSTGYTLGNNGVINASLEKGELFKTTDNGNTWIPVETGFTNKLNKLDSFGDNICIVGSNKSDDLANPDFVLLSLDGGAKWKRIKHDAVVAGWEDVYFISEKKILLTGHDGLIIQLDIK